MQLAPTDQRGDAAINSTYAGYTSIPCVDAGAVQTNYSLTFVQQPSTVPPNVVMSPVPEVELLESGAAFANGANTFAIPLRLSTGPGAIIGSIASTSAMTGLATYAAVRIATPAADDVLTATLALNPAANPAPTLRLASNAFNVSKLGTTTLLTISSASLTPAQSETLTAQVLSSTTGTPTGDVSFYDGTTLLGTATLNGGTASYSTAVAQEGGLAKTVSEDRLHLRRHPAAQPVNGSRFWMQGGAAQIHGQFYAGWGVVADIAAAHTANIDSTGVGLDLITASFGLRG